MNKLIANQVIYSNLFICLLDEGDNLSMVQGGYTYFHYLHDGIDDKVII